MSGCRGPKRKSRKRGSKGTNASKGEAPRRAEPLRIAADLFADRGYVATTVRDIAGEAGILSGSLYHHFDSKESMIDAILSTFVEETHSGYAAVVAEGHGPRETFEGLVKASLGPMTVRRSAILIWTDVLEEAPRRGSSARTSTRNWSTRICEQYLAVLEEGVAKRRQGTGQR